MRVISPVEGRFHSWGKCEEYDAWLLDTGPQAARRGRSPAVRSIGVGETIAVPVDVHNWSDSPQSGTVGLTLPANFTADAATRPYGPLTAGEHATVEFELTTTDHSDAGGGYDLEVKIPMADLPAAVDPDNMARNITPYDNDNTAAEGSTTLRHIDMSTRLGSSAFNSVQCDPWLWGHANVTGYTPPADRPATPADPPPDYGMTACAPTEGTVPPWSPDMSGRLQGSAEVELDGGFRRVTIPLSAAQRAKLAEDGSALISFETPADEVQALEIRLASR